VLKHFVKNSTSEKGLLIRAVTHPFHPFEVTGCFFNLAPCHGDVLGEWRYSFTRSWPRY